MNLSERFNALLAARNAMKTLSTLENGKNALSGLSLPETFFLQRENFSEEELKELVAWLLNGGEFYFTEEARTPYGERKNSKKKFTRQTFTLKREGFQLTVGCVTVSQNYQERGLEYMMKEYVNNLFTQGESELGFYNGGLLKYVCSLREPVKKGK